VHEKASVTMSVKVSAPLKRVDVLRARALKGYTLTEIVIVVLIIGFLAMMAVPRYFRAVEKSRTAEARNILGQIRDAEIAYYLEYNAYTNLLANIQLGALPAGCNVNYYFTYSVTPAGAAFTATATRCTGGAGKQPGSPASMGAYTVTLTDAGVLGGTASGLGLL